MPETLKDFFDRALVARMAAAIGSAHPPFAGEAFTRDAARGLDRLELMARARHIAAALHAHLPADYRAAARIIRAALPAEAPTEGGAMATFFFLPFTEYVSRYGLEDPATSFELLYELTRRFTAEFAIRPFLERYPADTLAALRGWTRDPDPHVRRLVSEGTRPRLPWAARLRSFQRDPRPVIELLDLLKDDPELFVRRSVANNLNDIGKDHPDLLVETCRRWLRGATPEREWIVRHALRSAVKRGEAGALALLGHGRAPAVEIVAASAAPRRAAIGGHVEISFRLRATGREPQQLLVDLRVCYAKADGSMRPKVFKLGRVELAGGAEAAFRKRIALKQLSTRTHYPGLHRVEALVNGVAYLVGEFTVVQAKRAEP